MSTITTAAIATYHESGYHGHFTPPHGNHYRRQGNDQHHQDDVKGHNQEYNHHQGDHDPTAPNDHHRRARN